MLESKVICGTEVHVGDRITWEIGYISMVITELTEDRVKFDPASARYVETGLDATSITSIYTSEKLYSTLVDVKIVDLFTEKLIDSHGVVVNVGDRVTWGDHVYSAVITGINANGRVTFDIDSGIFVSNGKPWPHAVMPGCHRDTLGKKLMRLEPDVVETPSMFVEKTVRIGINPGTYGLVKFGVDTNGDPCNLIINTSHKRFTAKELRETIKTLEDIATYMEEKAGE